MLGRGPIVNTTAAICVCVLSRHFNDLMSSFGSTFNKVYGLEFSLLIIIVRCYSFRVEPPLAIRIITTTLFPVREEKKKKIWKK